MKVFLQVLPKMSSGWLEMASTRSQFATPPYNELLFAKK